MAADDDAAATRRRRKRTGMGGISALPEHLQHEVFSRVGDVKALFRFAATCRGWLRRFTDPAFLRELCPSPLQGSGSGHGHRARLLGVFLQDSWFHRFDKAMVRARTTTMAAQRRASSSSSPPRACLEPVFLPALGSPLGPAGRALTSFAGAGGDDGDGTFDYAELLAARRGIVLVRLAPRTREEMNCGCHLLGVCNPVTGDRHVLPPLDWRRLGAGSRLVSYAIITAADSHSGKKNGMMPDHHRHPPAAAARFTFSQLLVITQDGGDRRRRRGEVVDAAYLHSYSAATRRWSAPTTCLDTRVFSLVGATRPAVVHRGAAHWLCVGDGDGDDHHGLYRLSVEVATARVSLTSLPVRVGGKQLLCVSSDGELAVASVYPVHVTVWTQTGRAAGDDDDDDDDTTTAAAWPRTSFRIAPPQEHHDHEWWCDFNQGSLLALFRGSGVFILDVGTKAMEEVSILDFDNKLAMAFLGANPHLTCVPYEMDLVEFFTLQLGGIRERLVETTSTSETDESP